LILFFLVVLFSFQKKHITVYMIGDSTMSVKLPEKRPETGWGMPFATFFDNTVTIINRAMNGRSTRTFISENRWQPIVDTLKSGDYVFIQFGHNDESKEKTDRYTSPEDYTTNLIKFVTEARSKNAIPILLTPVVRRRYDSAGNFYDVHGVYPDKVREVAKQYHVALIDMQQSSAQLLMQLGKDGSLKLFNHLKPHEHPNYPAGITDDTHFNEYGALQMALLAKQGLIEIKSPLAERLNK